MITIRALVVIKNATDAPAFLIAVMVDEILVTCLLEPGVKTGIKPVANIFKYSVKKHGIFFK